jgi:NAD(P)-dependent dehydrogenase (short-subunit alcohol dehydrogenase family)
MIDCDLTGTFKSIRAVLPQMLKQNFGRIVVTSSMGGRQGIPNMAHYSAAKFGVIGLVKSLAMEVAATGITANVVCPSNVNTTMARHEYMWPLFLPDVPEPTDDQVANALAATNVQPWPWAEPEDVARLVRFLVESPTARFITGSTFDVGMGKTSLMP